MSDRKLVSIIIPCYNEAGNIEKLIAELDKIIKSHRYSFEVILVNDGSHDDTWEMIEKASRDHIYIHGIDQMGNFGQSQAYQAGFDVAKGDYIITLSADLEIPAKYIKQVIELLNDGYDFVNTNRVKRWNSKQEGVRRMQTGLGNMLLNKISGVKINDRGSGLKGFTKNLAHNLELYGDMHRFIPDYLSIYKPKYIEINVEFRDREYGVSAYKGSIRSLKVLLDILTLAFLIRFAHKPFFMMPGRLFGFSGFVIGALGSIVSFWMIVERLIWGIGLTNRPLFILSVMMTLIGLILMLFGLFGELMMRVYFESSHRKRYMIRRTV